MPLQFRALHKCLQSSGELGHEASSGENGTHESQGLPRQTTCLTAPLSEPPRPRASLQVTHLATLRADVSSGAVCLVVLPKGRLVFEALLAVFVWTLE
jgi:hypothetical protein